MELPLIDRILVIRHGSVVNVSNLQFVSRERNGRFVYVGSNWKEWVSFVVEPYRTHHNPLCLPVVALAHPSCPSTTTLALAVVVVARPSWLSTTTLVIALPNNQATVRNTIDFAISHGKGSQLSFSLCSILLFLSLNTLLRRLPPPPLSSPSTTTLDVALAHLSTTTLAINYQATPITIHCLPVVALTHLPWPSTTIIALAINQVTVRSTIHFAISHDKGVSLVLWFMRITHRHGQKRIADRLGDLRTIL
ncbi:hypothetical protein L6452_35609 [Arctium lappa]|uniref:Uncharacterized protein n=1 Tax=Arctium lappa TaxID=4217 RepID=A0ACB8Y837_ARCLA|nr:hypothetical protein L6452_35609 [Arctium lappa]